MLDEGIGKGLINRAIGLSSLSFCHKSGKVVYFIIKKSAYEIFTRFSVLAKL